MNLSNFVAYVKQAWKNKPDTSTPLSAERLTHQEEGIKGNSDAIQELAAAVVSQIVNNPDKIASMAALYAVNQKVTTLDGKVGDTAKLPSGTADVASAVAQLYSNIGLNPIKTYKVQDVNVETNTLQKWIINNFVPPVSILNIFNDKSAAMFDETGNFNIIAFGPHSDAIVILVVNHWTGHSWIIGGIDTANYGNWQWLKLFS